MRRKFKPFILEIDGQPVTITRELFLKNKPIRKHVFKAARYEDKRAIEFLAAFNIREATQREIDEYNRMLKAKAQGDEIKAKK